YQTHSITCTPAHREQIESTIAVGDIIDPETGEVYLESGETIGREHLDKIYASAMKSVTILKTKTEQGKAIDPLILASLRDDPTSTHEEALLKIYQIGRAYV